MRFAVLTSITCLAVAFSACNTTKSALKSTDADATQRQRNLAADAALIGIFESGDVDKLDAIIDPAFVNHASTGDRVGLDSLKTGVRTFHARMKRVKIDRKHQLTDGNYISDWVRFNGADPSMAFEGMEVTRYMNGKAVEHWFFPNSQALKN